MKRAAVSSIFNWYAADFGDTARFLAKYAPPDTAFLAKGEARIEFKDYNWGLNDQGGHGAAYGGWRFAWDYFWNK